MTKLTPEDGFTVEAVGGEIKVLVDWAGLIGIEALDRTHLEPVEIYPEELCGFALKALALAEKAEPAEGPPSAQEIEWLLAVAERLNEHGGWNITTEREERGNCPHCGAER